VALHNPWYDQIVICNLLNFAIAISSVSLFPRVLPWITSYKYVCIYLYLSIYLYIYMSISIGWITKMDLLDHRTCSFENVIYFQLDYPPKVLCQWAILPTCGSAHFPTLWLRRNTLNGLHFCQFDQQEIAPHLNSHIPVTREVTVHIFFSYFICLLGIWISSFMKCLFKSLPFFYWFIYLLLLICKTGFYEYESFARFMHWKYLFLLCSLFLWN